MISVLLFLLGLSFGSFTNALTWRLHEQSLPKKKRVTTDKKLSIATGRSMCPDCQHILFWYDLLPVISWLGLVGKCRYCRQPISWHYPAVELLTASLYVFSYIYWPSSLHTPVAILLFAIWLSCVTAFMALSIYDLKWMILPDRIIFPMIVMALLFAVGVIFSSHASKPHLIMNTILSVLCSAGLFFAIFQISRGKWIGGGDVKLAVILGLLLGGPLQAFLMLFLASLMGSVVGVPLMLLGSAKRDTKLPFGPFLIVATIIVYLFGSSLITLYKRRILLI